MDNCGMVIDFGAIDCEKGQTLLEADGHKPDRGPAPMAGNIIWTGDLCKWAGGNQHHLGPFCR